MFTNFSPHFRAVLLGLFVTFLWSTSWIIIKIGLRDMPPLTFAGMRYTLAFLCLLPLALRREQRQIMRGLSRSQVLWLARLGVLHYAIAQGGQFVALNYLPAASLSLLLNFMVIIVAVLGAIFLSERLRFGQVISVGVFIVGVLIYFYPVNFSGTQVVGLAAGCICLLANAGGSVMGRHINSVLDIPPLIVTVISMGIGSVGLLLAGVFTQGWPALTLLNMACIVWLAVVNTAFAFTLWNQTLRTLSAVEAVIITNTMLVQIAGLAWLFLGESITLQEGLGLLMVAGGILIGQLHYSNYRQFVTKLWR